MQTQDPIILRISIPEHFGINSMVFFVLRKQNKTTPWQRVRICCYFFFFPKKYWELWLERKDSQANVLHISHLWRQLVLDSSGRPGSLARWGTNSQWSLFGDYFHFSWYELTQCCTPRQRGWRETFLQVQAVEIRPVFTDRAKPERMMPGYPPEFSIWVFWFWCQTFSSFMTWDS